MDFFAEPLNQDGLFFLACMLISFLIGWLVGWLIRGGAVARHRKEAEKWKASYDDLLGQHNALREEVELKDADLVKAQREAEEARQLADALLAEKNKWQNDLDGALEESVRLQASISSQEATIEDLNSQIIGLKTQNAELQANAGSGATSTTQAATLERLNELEAKLNALSTESTGGDEAATQRLAALEEKVNNLAAENEQLKTQLAAQPLGTANDNGSGATPDEDIYAPAPEKTDVEKGEAVAVSAVSARADILAASGTAWPTATEADKDDLTRIKGVGSFLEKKLNGLGIYTYEQLCKLTPEWTERLTTAIEFFPGRIERDDWVGQSTRLMAIKAEHPEALEPSAVFVKNPEYLKIVEGIGPKIEELLKNEGIKDWEILATTPDSQIRDILTAAGNKYRMHDPTTWPTQAELAARGEWDTLKDLQDKLKGGKEV
jgi:predicted flap endonuclease-1-like 5' DNA nuclease